MEKHPAILEDEIVVRRSPNPQGLRLGLRCLRSWAMGALLLAQALQIGCGGNGPPGVQVASSNEMGTVTQSSLIVGRDGGFGIHLWNHEVFIFGDTFVSKPDVNGSTFHSNSFSYTDSTDAENGITLTELTDAAGSPLTLLTPTTTEAAFNMAHSGDSCAQTPCGARYATWPGSTVFDPASGSALVSYGLIYATPGAFNFSGLGQSLAVWSSFAEQAVRPEIGNCSDYPTLLFCQDDPPWGEALVLVGEELYAFACQNLTFSASCMLARVNVGSVLDRSTWQAWDGEAWQPGLNAAQPLFNAGNNLRVFYNQYAGAYMAVYSASVSNNVNYRTAPAITGPWSDESLLFVADHNADDGGWTYDATVQPDYSENDGQIVYVTYSRPNGNPFGSEFAIERVAFK
jgi:hypothetical protein